MDLFDENLAEDMKVNAPLADRMRPRTLDEFLGQSEIFGSGKVLRSLVERDEIPSMIFWGPPGCGKTTLARIIATTTKSRFIPISATGGSVKDIREIVREADEKRRLHGERTILFVDEIHRFNKSQQDSFLPHVENGTISLIGATTENPSFEVNSALLSRCRVFVFKTLSEEDLSLILRNAISDKERGLGKMKIKISEDAIDLIARLANGDARSAMNTLELAVRSAPKKGNFFSVTITSIKECLQKTHLVYDKKGEFHYDIISALHKSMRGSDPSASLYYLARMLEGGEDPLYVARRIVRFASEDIGIANPAALTQAVATYQACHFLGMPECSVNLAQAVVYMAKCPKSNTLYTGYEAAKREIMEHPEDPVPMHLRNAPTKLMKELGYSKGYKYNPNFKGQKVDQEYLPERLKGRKFFE